MANTPWILTIDADEVLTVEQGRHLSTFVSGSTAAVEIKVTNGRAYWYVTRLFKKTTETKYVGLVHEWLSTDGNIARSDQITITNLPDKTGKESSIERDLRLCHEELQIDPTNMRAAFYLARALRRNGEHLKALEYYDAVKNKSDSKILRYNSAIQSALSNMLIQKYEDAFEAAQFANSLVPLMPDAYCLMGDASLGLSNIFAAREYYELALQARPSNQSGLFHDESSRSEYPSSQLSMINRILSKID